MVNLQSSQTRSQFLRIYQVLILIHCFTGLYRRFGRENRNIVELGEADETQRRCGGDEEGGYGDFAALFRCEGLEDSE